MKPTRILLIAIIGLLIGAGTGLGIRLLQSNDASTAADTQASTPLLNTIPAFSYPDLEGRMHNGSEWGDRIVVLNFWASWCPPCRKETPLFVELQQQYAADNVRFIGIAIDDKEPVQEFVDSYGVVYPVLLGNLDAIALSKRLGNRFEGLPFTVVAEPGGKVALRHQGGISREQLEPVLKQAIEHSRRTYATPERI